MTLRFSFFFTLQNKVLRGVVSSASQRRKKSLARRDLHTGDSVSRTPPKLKKKNCITGLLQQHAPESQDSGHMAKSRFCHDKPWFRHKRAKPLSPGEIRTLVTRFRASDPWPLDYGAEWQKEIIREKAFNFCVSALFSEAPLPFVVVRDCVVKVCAREFGPELVAEVEFGVNALVGEKA